MKVLIHPLCLTAVILMIGGVYSLPHKMSVVPREEALQFLSDENSDEKHENEPTPAAPPTEQPAPKVHPCFNTTVNRTVTTAVGDKILCLVPSDADLLKNLKESGGFNKHYVAVTKEEADENFEDPFNPLVHTKEPDWLNVTGRRRRSIHENDYKMGNVKAELGNDRRKRSVSGLRFCVKQGERNSMGLVQLCEECWWISILPNDRFPRYINERICGQDGASSSPPTTFCNRYSGQCIQRSLTQDLLVRTDRYEKIASPDPHYTTVYKQVWEPYGQPIRSCCQCQNF